MVKLTTTNGVPFVWRSQILTAHSIMDSGAEMNELA